MPVEQLRAVRVGSTEPRIFTPPLRPLTPETSLGFEVLEFADSFGIFLYPWQRWLLIHALELNTDGTFRFRTVLVLVARQNGKSTAMQVLTMWRMFIDAAKMVIGTAQNLDISEEQWSEVISKIAEIPELNDRVLHIDRGTGKKALRLRTGERYKIAAANRRGGRGLAGDLILLDELREHTNWDAWAAVTKTTLARPRAQVWCASNAGDHASIVLRFLRNQAHAKLGNPDDIKDIGEVSMPTAADQEEGEGDTEFSDSLGIFEWSTPPGLSKWNRDGWAMANPSMNIDTDNPDEKLTEKAIAAAAGTDPDRVFRTEVLCQWPENKNDGPYPMAQWKAAEDPLSSRVGRYMLCVDVSHDGSTAYIGMAGKRADGLLHVQVVAARAGTAWVKDWLKDHMSEPDFGGVAMQAHGAPVSQLLIELQQIEGLNVIPWAGSSLGQGFGLFWSMLCGFDPDEQLMDLTAEVDVEERVRPPLLMHRSQPALDVAVAQAATKPSGDSWLLDRARSPVDIAPLIAVNGAAWAFFAHAPVVKKRSKYEDEDPLVMGGI